MINIVFLSLPKFMKRFLERTLWKLVKKNPIQRAFDYYFNAALQSLNQ